MRAAVSLALAILMLAACGASEPVAEPSEPARVREPEPATAELAAPEPAPPEPAPLPYVPDPKGFGDPCSEQEPCGWDDPCVATRCVAASHVRSDVACEESAPPPGECECVEGRCALRPSRASEVVVSCAMSACGLDQGAGKCVEGTMLDANRSPRDRGPACHCGITTPTCTFVWVEPIACETVEQCWVSDTAPYHPIARPPALRRKTFEPCKDGEFAPACSDGFCSVRGFSC